MDLNNRKMKNHPPSRDVFIRVTTTDVLSKLTIIDGHMYFNPYNKTRT